MTFQPLQVDLVTQRYQYGVLVVALELSRFDPRSLMNDPLGKQKANRKFSVRSRCPHRNRHWFLNHTWTPSEANTDLKRLFNCQCIAGILRRLVRSNAFNNKPLRSFNDGVF